MDLNESLVEGVALERLEELGYEVSHGSRIALGEAVAERVHSVRPC